MQWITRILIALCLGFAPSISWGQVLLFEDFDQGIPSNWTVIDHKNDGHTWQVVNDYVDNNGPQQVSDGAFALVNSDAAGLGDTLFEALYLPVINGDLHSNLFLEFDHVFRALPSGDSAAVEVFDGTDWILVDSWKLNEGSWTTAKHETFNLTDYLNPNLQIRFVYRDLGEYAWYWAIDKVRITTPIYVDLSISDFLSQPHNGRHLTSASLSMAETIVVEITNHNTSPVDNFKLWYAVNDTIYGPEIYSDTLEGGAVDTFQFTSTVNLSAVGTYQFRAWTDYLTDLDHVNDTLASPHIVRQLPNNLLSLPFADDFESLSDLTLTDTLRRGISSLDYLDYTNSSGNGRLRTSPSSFLSAQSGTKALTIDREQFAAGTPEINDLIFTFNLSDKDVNEDEITLSLAYREYGDEPDAGDQIWIRGNDQDSWLNLFDWGTASNNGSGYQQIIDLPLTPLLLANAQNYSTSFQIRVGQEGVNQAVGNFSNDGLTIDDIKLNQSNPSDARPLSIVTPQSNDCGDTATVICAAVLNSGVDTLPNLPVIMQWSSTAGPTGVDTAYAMGLLPPGDTAIVCFSPINMFGGGTLDITLISDAPTDDLHSNDTLTAQIFIRSVDLAPVLNDSICRGDSSLLIINRADSFTTYAWYDEAVGGNLIAISDSLQTSALFSDTTYYVEIDRDRSWSAGLPNNFNPGGAGPVFDKGVVFDVFYPIILDSVKVYPSGTGEIRVILTDGFGVLQQERIFALDTLAGSQPVWLTPSFYIPVGSGWEIRADGSTVAGLWNQVSGVSYQNLGVPGVIDLLGPAGPGASNSYYFFYDWQLRAASCPGTRTPVTVEVNDSVAAGFTWVANGSEITFTDTSLQEPGSHFWDFGDGLTSTAANPIHDYAIDSIYVACLTANNGCSSEEFCDTIRVCETLHAGFVANTSNLNVTFIDTSHGQATAWSWDFGDSAGGLGPGLTHTYSSGGTYFVTLTISNACGEVDSIIQAVTVCDPVFAFFTDTTVDGLTWNFFDLTSGPAAAWQWTFGDGTSDSVANPLHTFPNDGPYQVVLTVFNACGDSSIISQFITAVGMGEVNAPMEIQVYPNPFDSHLRIDIKGWQGSFNALLFDQAGRQCAEAQFKTHQSAVEWNTGVESPGLYHLVILPEKQSPQHFQLIKP